MAVKLTSFLAKVSESLVDPCLLEAMRDPVTFNPCGHSGDRSTLSRVHVCPQDRTLIKESVSNPTLKSLTDKVRNASYQAMQHCVSGKRLMSQGKYEAAKMEFIQALGLDSNFKEAETYLIFCRSMQQAGLPTHGDKDALFQIGLLCERGIGMPPSPEKADAYYALAANLTHPEAQFKVGEKYEVGRGVESSNGQAFKWYYAAASRGNVDAQLKVAEMYRSGRGVRQSMLNARIFYERAGAQGSAEAFFQLGLIYAKDKASLAKAAECFKNAAEKGHVQSMRYTGIAYNFGIGVIPSLKEGFHWYQRAAELGDGIACYLLGCCYEHGKGTAQSCHLAIESYEKAIELGCESAKYALGVKYQSPDDVEETDKRIYKLYSDALRWSEVSRPKIA